MTAAVRRYEAIRLQADFIGRLDAACAAPGGAALILVGIGRLDFVNWNLGFDGGNAILDAVAARLEAIFPGRSIDEPWPGKFALVVPGIDAREAMHMAHRVVAQCSVPHVVGRANLFNPPYVGVALSARGVGGGQLLQNALFAMEDARRQTLGAAQFYDPAHKTRIEFDFRIENGMRESFETGDHFRLAFQPLVALDGSGRLAGFEALARWNHPELGLVPPERFIPVAERSGLIQGLGNFILWEACRHLVAWDAISAAPLTMSVNLSAVQLAAPGIEEAVEEALDTTGADPRRIKLEVTETALASDIDTVARKIARLRRIGVAIGVDDFGAGYSSLGQLDHFGLDFMKIDKKLIQGLDADARRVELVRLTIALGKHLGMELVAEGIETEAQHRIVAHLGADLGQGYLFSPPMPARDAEDWVRAGKAAPGAAQTIADGTTARSNPSASM